MVKMKRYLILSLVALTVLVSCNKTPKSPYVRKVAVS